MALRVESVVRVSEAHTSWVCHMRESTLSYTYTPTILIVVCPYFACDVSVDLLKRRRQTNLCSIRLLERGALVFNVIIDALSAFSRVCMVVSAATRKDNRYSWIDDGNYSNTPNSYDPQPS